MVRYTYMPFDHTKKSGPVLLSRIGARVPNTNLYGAVSPSTSLGHRFLSSGVCSTLSTVQNPRKYVGPPLCGPNGLKRVFDLSLALLLNDPRVTAIGRILRRLSLDEFLQLVNVIKGEMSLVGPRPHAAETTVEGILFEDAVQSYPHRYAAKPGMTGLAQIRGHRGQTRTIKQLEDRVASDIEYIQNWSIWLDLYILVKTIPAILKRENAY